MPIRFFLKKSVSPSVSPPSEPSKPTPPKPAKPTKHAKQSEPAEPILKTGARVKIINPLTGEYQPGHWILGDMNHKDALFDRQAWQIIGKNDPPGLFRYRFPEHVEPYE